MRAAQPCRALSYTPEMLLMYSDGKLTENLKKERAIHTYDMDAANYLNLINGISDEAEVTAFALCRLLFQPYQACLWPAATQMQDIRLAPSSTAVPQHARDGPQKLYCYGLLVELYACNTATATSPNRAGHRTEDNLCYLLASSLEY
eukprot:IDg16957t1